MTRFSEAEMKKHNVEIIDKRKVRLKCLSCGMVWSPMVGSEGRLPRNYWQCPKGCNIVVPSINICKRCSHSWASNQEEPSRCPHCNSPYWNKERTR